MNTIHVYWKEDANGHAGWSVPHGAGRRDFLFDSALVDKLPRDLRDRKAVETFEEFATNSDFQKWWLASCGNAQLAQPRFVLHFPAESSWRIAWELLLGELRFSNPAHVSIVRAVEKLEPPLASRFDDKLRILMIKGDPGQPALDLDAEVNGVLRAFSELSSLRANAETPVVFDGSISELSNVIADSKPHIVWFSGHGRASTAGFLMNGGWAQPTEIAAAIAASGHIPLMAVFWACHTGAKGQQRELFGGLPAMFEALRRIGIHSLLAMQAPVYDNNAADMAREFFLNLAAGRTIDFAAAAARARIFKRTLSLDSTLDRDWACPVVWSSSVPAEDLHWNSPPEQRLAQLQLAGQGTVDALVTRYGASFDPRDHGETARAWINYHRAWVLGTPDVEHALLWAATLIAIQSTTKHFVLAIELEQGSAAEALQKWAEKVQQRLDRRDFPVDDFLPALEALRVNPAAGWPRFAHLSGAAIAIRNPPASSETWFWDAIDNGNSNPVIVFSSSSASASPIRIDWQVERIDMLKPAEIAEARKSAPTLIDTLAVLDMPASNAQLNAVDLDVDAIKHLTDLLIETQGGVFLRASASQFARANMSDAELVQAHANCLGILDFRVKLTTSVRERRFFHCIGAGAAEAAAQEALALFEHYRIEERPRAAVQLFERAASARAMLPSAYIFVSWAHLMLGDIDQAEFFLSRFYPHEPFKAAWAAGIRAEICKARGDRDGALAAIAEAIAALEGAEADAAGIDRNELLRQTLVYRQDHARIRQYLFRDYETAASEYAALLNEWRNQPGADVEVAVIMRNYQECLRSMSKSHGDRLWEEARHMLNAAWEHLDAYRETTIAAEVCYEMSKFAEEDGDLNRASRLLADAENIAAKSGSLMLHAIIRSRRFWANGSYDHEKWEEISANLSAYADHGWPIRTLLKGRLRAAKRLLDLREHDLALTQLKANLDTLVQHPAFTEGSDRFKIAATAAGLFILKQEEAWQEFEKTEWAGAWMLSRHFADAAAVWGAVD